MALAAPSGKASLVPWTDASTRAVMNVTYCQLLTVAPPSLMPGSRDCFSSLSLRISGPSSWQALRRTSRTETESVPGWGTLTHSVIRGRIGVRKVVPFFLEDFCRQQLLASVSGTPTLPRRARICFPPILLTFQRKMSQPPCLETVTVPFVFSLSR